MTANVRPRNKLGGFMACIHPCLLYVLVKWGIFKKGLLSLKFHNTLFVPKKEKKMRVSLRMRCNEK